MSLRKTYLTVGVVWAAPLAVAAAAATVQIFLRAGWFSPGFESPGLIVVVLAALMAFAGSIVAGASYGERLAHKRPWARAGEIGAFLIFLGVLASVFVAVGMLGLVLPHGDEMNLEFFAEEVARESAGE